MSLELNSNTPTFFLPVIDESEAPETMSFCSLSAREISNFVAASATSVCDPYFDLRLPNNHPLRASLYADESIMMSQEVMQGITRLGDHRLSIQAVVGEGENRQKVNMDIAQLPGGAYLVMDHVRNESTLYINNGKTKIKLLANGTALMSSPSGLKTVKESFMINQGANMLKVNPRTGGIHIFAPDGTPTTVTAPAFWRPAANNDEV